MITYGVFNPGSFVAPSAPISILNIDHTIQYIRVLNNSPYQLAINLGGNIIQISEFWQKDIAVGNVLPSIVIITPSLAITSDSHRQASQLTVQGLVATDGGGDLDGAIPQQAVNVTATGQPLFTTQIGLGSSANNIQRLNIFNPANSGTIMEFHSAKASTNSAGIPPAALVFTPGADLNFVTPVSIVSHTGNATPPVSVGHATFQDVNTSIGGTVVEFERIPGSSTQETIDLLTFPDTMKLYPGVNLTLSIADTTAGHTIQLTLKHTEITVTPAITILGPGMIANAIKNDGNPLGTSIIEATPSGAPQAIQLFNDGTGFYAVDQSGVAHRVFTFNSSGNPLQLGQVGDVLEALGNLTVDNLLTAFASFATNNPATVINGSVSGTISFFTPIWGSALKILIITMNNYNSASVASFNLPSAMNWTMGLSGNYNTSQTFSLFSGTAQNMQQLTALGGAGAAGSFSVSQTAMHSGCFFVSISSWNQFQMGTVGSGQTSSIVIIGV